MLLCVHIYIYVCVNHHELSIPYDDIVALAADFCGSLNHGMFTRTATQRLRGGRRS